MQQLLETIARSAGEILLRYFGTMDLQRMIKTHIDDFATQADLEAEAYIKDQLHQCFPNDRLLGEETGYQGPETSDYTWIIDPLDGTYNFAHGSDEFGVMIARAHGREIQESVIYYPRKDIILTASAGQGTMYNGELLQCTFQQSLDESEICVVRFDPPTTPGQVLVERCRAALQHRGINTDTLKSSAATALAMLQGQKAGFIINQNYAWDNAAIALLLQEAGFMVTDFTGQPIDPTLYRQDLLTATPQLHQELLQLLSV